MKGVFLWIFSLTFSAVAIFLILTNRPTEVRRQEISTKDYFSIVHITDTHISLFDERPTNNLKVLCNTLPILQPDIVLLTGDLCHGRKNGHGFYPHKYPKEYEIYNSLVDYCKNIYFVPWVDLIGNHDVDSLSNRTKGKTIQLHDGVQNGSIQTFDLNKNGNTIQIIGIDTYSPSAIPHDEDGFISSETYNDVFHLLNDTNYTYSIIATHQPTYWIQIDNIPFPTMLARNGVSSKVAIALSGHFHFSEMRAFHDGFLEAELNALKNDYFRVIILKNHFAYFNDFKLEETLHVVFVCPNSFGVDCSFVQLFCPNKIESLIFSYGGSNYSLFSNDSLMWYSDVIVPFNVPNMFAITLSYKKGEKWQSKSFQLDSSLKPTIFTQILLANAPLYTSILVELSTFLLIFLYCHELLKRTPSLIHFLSIFFLLLLYVFPIIIVPSSSTVISLSSSYSSVFYSPNQTLPNLSVLSFQFLLLLLYFYGYLPDSAFLHFLVWSTHLLFGFTLVVYTSLFAFFISPQQIYQTVLIVVSMILKKQRTKAKILSTLHSTTAEKSSE